MKKDYYLAAIIGFLAGWLSLLPLKNAFGVVITPRLVAGFVLSFALLTPAAFFALNILAKRWNVLGQFGKFAAVGALGTFLDLGILNGLIILTGTAAGWHFTFFKSVSFFFASINNYFWNKFWTFESHSVAALREYLKFLLVMIIGMMVNVTVASLLVNVIGAPPGVEMGRWVNVSAAIAVVFSGFCNFFNLRLFVFGIVNNQKGVGGKLEEI